MHKKLLIIIAILLMTTTGHAKDRYRGFWICYVVVPGTFKPNRIIFKDGRSFIKVDDNVYEFEKIRNLYNFENWQREPVMMSINMGPNPEPLLKDQPFDGYGKMVKIKKYGKTFYRLIERTKE